MALSTLIVYAPHIFRDFSVVYRHYDGPFYMYIARTFYIIPAEHPFSPALPSMYYAAHLPLFPILIRISTIFTLGHYPSAMVLATLVSSTAAAVLFLKVLQAWKLVEHPFWTAVLFCFIPPRWLFQHSIGASEPLFICFVFGAFLALKKEKTWLVVLCISLASLSRITGVLLVPVFGIIYALRKDWKSLRVLPLALVGILTLFLYYQQVYGDFLAFFRWHTSQAFKSGLERSSLIGIKPLEIFRFYAERPNFHSTELYLLLYVAYLAGTLALWKRREFFIYSLVYFLFSLFIFHYDLPRVLLFLAPFAILIGFDNILTSPQFRWFVFPVVLYLAYIYVWGWMPQAVCTSNSFQELLLQIHGPPE